jgi:hypothetical protein
VCGLVLRDIKTEQDMTSSSSYRPLVDINYVEALSFLRKFINELRTNVTRKILLSFRSISYIPPAPFCDSSRPLERTQQCFPSS